MIIEPPNSVNKIMVGCIMTYSENFLLFQSTLKSTWSSLRGDVQDDESINMAIKREIREKLGLIIIPEYFTVSYHRYGDENVAYYLFKYKFLNDPSNDITLSKEYNKFGLFSYADASKLKLIEDEEFNLKLYEDHVKKSK
ncbi:NUDIX domain-containing protein [Candidatus Woesearchaeota archaeon]|nr:NUDIX domain-containing protein [Candidatus Woesearchaeota archaeon]